MLIWNLFRTFFLIGAFSFGGGLASMEVIRSRVVDQQMWLTNAEFSDIVSISEMTPGPLGINIASFVGVRVGGVPGTLAATFAYVLPPFFMILALAWFYYKYRSLTIVQGVLKGLRPAIAAMVVASATSLTISAVWGSRETIAWLQTNYVAIILCAVFLGLLRSKKLGPVQVILISGVVGAGIYAVTGL